jgi:hypothetical protein
MADRKCACGKVHPCQVCDMLSAPCEPNIESERETMFVAGFVLAALQGGIGVCPYHKALIAGHCEAAQAHGVGKGTLLAMLESQRVASVRPEDKPS